MQRQVTGRASGHESNSNKQFPILTQSYQKIR